MKKRGQLGIFILLAIIVAVAIISLLFLSSREIEVPSAQPPLQQIKIIYSSCLNEVSKNALFVVGQQAGYAFLPEDESKVFLSGNQEQQDLSFLEVPYVYNKGQTSVPSLEFIEKEIADFVEVELVTCLASKDLEEVSEGYTIDFKNTRPEVSESLEEKILFKVNNVAKLSKGTASFDLGIISTGLPSRIKFIQEVMTNSAKRLAAEKREGITDITLDYLYTTGLKVDIYPFDNNDVVFVMHDPLTVYDGESYTFMFAVKL